MEPMKWKISNKSPVISDADERIIEGWASTNDLDRYNEVVDPEAFKESLKTYMKNPIMFFGHEWWSLPVGKVLKAEIRDKGLWIQAKISESADEVWGLIKEGILKTFSIGYALLKYETDTKTEITTLLNLELLEVSVVSIPANPEAMIELAKSKGINIKSFNAPENGAKSKELKVEPITKEDVQKIVTDKIGAYSDGAKTQYLSVDDAKKTQEDIRNILKDVITEDQVDSKTKELYDKVKVDLKASTDVLVKDIMADVEQKWVTPKKMDHGNLDQAKRLGMLDKLKGANGAPSAKAFKSLLLDEKVDTFVALTGLNEKKELLKELQTASDDLMFVAAALGYIEDGVGENVIWREYPGGLKTYQKYRRLMSEFAKALDTETTAEGSEWLPTVMSATLVSTLDIDRGVIKRIPRTPMPSASWPWPLQTSRPVPYKKSEATQDANINTLILSTAGTGNITFTAKGLGVGSITSTELIEDSIIAILPKMKEDFVFAMIDAEENIIINGDNSTTHQDTDHAAGSSALAVKILKGLRYMALNASTTSYVDLDTTFTYADLTSVMKLAGKYGLKPGIGFWAVSYSAYFKLWSMSEFKSRDYRSSTVVEKGIITDIFGHDMIPSEHMRQDLGPAGINAASDNDHTGIMYVNPQNFMIGDRRKYTVESDRKILSGQVLMVGTERIDFQKMAPTADTPVAFGYNIQN